MGLVESLLFSYFESVQIRDPLDRAATLLRLESQQAFRRNELELCSLSDHVLSDFCFDAEAFARHATGTESVIADLREYDVDAGAPVFGVAMPAERAFFICERTLSYRPLQRATICHEIAHLMLHSKTKFARFAPRARRRPQIEIEADNFMRECLLPRSILYLAIVTAARLEGIHPSEAFNCDSSRGRWQWRKFFFASLIDKLCVSRELIAWYMNRLGLMSEQTVEFHLSYALETKWWTPQPICNFAKLIDEFQSIHLKHT